MTNTRLRRLIASTFSLPEDKVPEAPSVADLAEWDSGGHLELMMAIELEYGVRIPTELMAELTSAETIESFLHGQGIGEAA